MTHLLFVFTTSQKFNMSGCFSHLSIGCLREKNVSPTMGTIEVSIFLFLHFFLHVSSLSFFKLKNFMFLEEILIIIICKEESAECNSISDASVDIIEDDAKASCVDSDKNSIASSICDGTGVQTD